MVRAPKFRGEIVMKMARLWLLGSVCVIGSSGCAALTSRPTTPRPKSLAERSFPVDRFVEEHNRNAERIQSLTARPTVGVAGKLTGRVDGRLSMERPRNFKLELLRFGTPKANMGSNDHEFWFWVQNDGDDKSIYWCDYDAVESSSLPLTYQPDWIVEALGLKPISSSEAAGITVQPGPERGTTALVFPAAKSRADSYTRVVIVSNQTRRIKEYRILASDRRTILAQASVGRYSEYGIEGGKDGSRGVCFLPETVRVEWKREQLALDVKLQDVKLNQFDSSESANVFVEPTIAGYARVNLAELARSQGLEPGTAVRRTLPPPEVRPGAGGARLGRPVPMEDDAAVVPAQEKRVATSATPRRKPLEDLVGAPMPSPASPEAAQGAPALGTGADTPLIER
jgi:hypothetical protein